MKKRTSIENHGLWVLGIIHGWNIKTFEVDN